MQQNLKLEINLFIWIKLPFRIIVSKNKTWLLIFLQKFKLNFRLDYKNS